MSRKILILITIIVTFLATKGLALEVRPQDASGYPGETVTVSINVTGASEAIDALGMDLVYAPACLSFESLSKTALTANYYMLAPNELGSGRLRIGGFGVVDSFSDSGILVNLNFKIREGASGDCEISLLDFVADLKGATTNPAKVTIYSVPSPPSNLRTASISSDKIELAWNDNSLNETGFILERKTEGGTYLQIAEVSTNVPTFSDTDVNPNTRYYYRVKACSNSACSSYSNEISPAAPTQDATPPLSFNLL
ncbi:hypothetical protein KKH56_03215, partial [bacterium]|nr:hypothetical protein [bacterium]